MKRLIERIGVVLTVMAVFTVLNGIASPVSAAPMRIEVEADLRDLPRKLIHTTVTIPTAGAEATLWYPKWIPGIHGPRGPIENLGGLRIFDSNKVRIPWNRDALERFKFHAPLPPGTTEITVEVDYICGQPTVNSRGVDSYGNALLGAINWNTCIVYPDGVKTDAIEVALRVRLPEDWRYATALELASAEDGLLTFKPLSLETFLDSPLICGAHVRSIPIGAEAEKPVFLQLGSESASALQLDDDLIARYTNLVTEAELLLAARPMRPTISSWPAATSFPRPVWSICGQVSTAWGSEISWTRI